MKNSSLLLIILLILSLATVAQENKTKSTVNGIIIDESKHPLDYASVAIFKSSDSTLIKTTITEADGKFSFIMPETGSYYISSSMMGYNKATSNVFNLTTGQADFQLPTLELKGTANNLKEVKVSSSKPLLERRIDKVVMNVENNIIATGSNALEVLQKAPGVTVDQNDMISMKGKQGVLVMIDGKQTYMSSSDLASLLRNMQGSQIASIDLITNPSARYDAAGNSGIIDIKTKKNTSSGTNGSINLSSAYWIRFRNDAGVSINHRNEHFNFFGTYNYSNNKTGNFIDINRIATGSPNTYFAEESSIIKVSNDHNFKAGVDYFINSKNTIGILVNGYFSTMNATKLSNTNIGASFSKKDSSLAVVNLNNGYMNKMTYSVNYVSNLDSTGQQLSFDADYSNLSATDNDNFKNDYYFDDLTSIRPTVYNRNFTPQHIDIKAFKIDYTIPFKNKMKLEAGIKASWVKTDNDYLAEVLQDNNWTNNVNLSNHFLYNEQVNAAYLNLNRTFGKTTIQAGLRAEETKSDANSITNNNIIKRDYLDLFPSVFINQNISEKHDLTLSYGKRIDRPNYQDLNPFVSYLDQYTYQQGNPYLNPQYTNNFEAAYTFLRKYNVTLNYSHTRDAIREVILPDNDTKSFYQTFENLNTLVNYGVNFNIPVKILTWWGIYNNLNIFNQKYQSPDVAGQPINTSQTSFQYKLDQNFKFSENFSGEISTSYQSSTTMGVLKLKEIYSTDIGVSKSLLNKRINLKFAISDLFNTYETKLSSAYPGFNYNLSQKFDSRRAKIAFTYKFGNYGLKPVERKSSASETEQGRL